MPQFQGYSLPLPRFLRYLRLTASGVGEKISGRVKLHNFPDKIHVSIHYSPPFKHDLNHKSSDKRAKFSDKWFRGEGAPPRPPSPPPIDFYRIISVGISVYASDILKGIDVVKLVLLHIKFIGPMRWRFESEVQADGERSMLYGSPLFFTLLCYQC